MPLRILALAALLVACHEGPVLEVRVSGLPEDTESLKLSARMLGQEDPWTQPLGGRPDLFDARLPAGTMGHGTLRVSAIGFDGCQVAEGSADFTVAASGRYPLAVLVTPRRGCSVTLSQNTDLGEAPGSIELSAAPLCQSARCNYQGRLGERVQLLPRPQVDTSFFSGWLGNGICRSAGLCSVQLGAEPLDLSYAFLPGQVCKDGFCWERPRPQGYWLYSVWAASPREVWAVGDAGTVLRYDGERWLPYRKELGLNLNRVHGLRPSPGRNATTVWIVGDGGAVLSWDGERLQPVVVATNKHLSAVWVNSATEVWITGESGTLLRGDGIAFFPVEPGTQENLSSLWSEGPGQPLWVGGGGGFLRRWDGHTWSAFDLPTAQRVSTLVGQGSQVWALTAGTAATDSAQLWRLTEQGFRLETAAGTVTRIFARGDAILGVDSYGIVWRWVAGAWHNLHRSEHKLSLNDISGTSDEDLWVVGEGGLIWHWAGAVWQAADPLEQIALSSIHGVIPPLDSRRPPEIYAGGKRGRLLYRNELGTSWPGLRPPIDTILGIWVAGPNDYWLAGGDLLHISTSKSKLISTPGLTSKPLLGVYGLSATQVFAVGASGTILRSDGQSATFEPSGTTVTLRAVWGADLDNLWAVGFQGTILRRQGGVWKTMRTGTMQEDLYAVWGSGPDNVWFVGANGTVIQWDGVRLTAVTLPPLRVGDWFFSVWTSGIDDVWLGSSLLWHWDGKGWSISTPAGITYLNGLWGYGRPGPDQHIYAVTSSGGILHRQGVIP